MILPTLVLLPTPIQRLGGVLLVVLLALPVYGQASESGTAEWVQASVEEAVERLDLTPEQQEAARPVLEASMAERLEILARHGIDLSGDGPIERPSRRTGRRLRSELSDLNEATEHQLKEVLTEAQMGTWQMMQEENREELRARFEDS